MPKRQTKLVLLVRETQADGRVAMKIHGRPFSLFDKRTHDFCGVYGNQLLDDVFKSITKRRTQ
ncbi:MAG: hypothetical protein ACYTEQ_01065 [Planctomycetota bacterium]|jgi:hypothetical protein